VNEEGAENDATEWNDDVTDERVQTLGIQVQRLELTINDMHRCINGLKLEVEQEQHLRHASEQALRDEMSRSLRVVTEQVALRADLAMANSARGSGSNVAHDIQQQPVQDLAVLRQEMLATVAELESGAQQLARQAAKQQIDLLWPALQQHVHAVVTEVRGRAQDQARQAAEQQIELLWPTLERQVYSQRANSIVGNDNASVLQSGSANPRPNSFHKKPHQLARPEQSMQALMQRIDISPRDSHPIQTFRRQGLTPNKEGSLAA